MNFLGVSLLTCDMYFHCNRNVLSALRESFTFIEEEFTENIAKRLKVYYDDWIRRESRGWINALSVDGTRLGAVSDVSPR